MRKRYWVMKTNQDGHIHWGISGLMGRFPTLRAVMKYLDTVPDAGDYIVLDTRGGWYCDVPYRDRKYLERAQWSKLKHW